MMGKYKAHTDLAMENGEKYEKDQVEIPGVIIRRKEDKEKEIYTTLVEITTEHGARMMEKPMGVYVTIEVPGLPGADEAYRREISQEMARHLKKMMPRGKESSVLVIGLGNRGITADALGPQVTDRLRVTRHVAKQFGTKALPEEDRKLVSALSPGVMAQTGMETLEIVKGVVEEVQPDVVIAVDALASLSIRRLNCTIQITDTGISPGSGVGNHRFGLNQETLQVPVIGIGVPTVVNAGTIIHDAVAGLLESLEESEIDDFLEELITPSLQNMYVTPKEIDETILCLSELISTGLNLAFSGKD